MPDNGWVGDDRVVDLCILEVEDKAFDNQPQPK